MLVTLAQPSIQISLVSFINISIQFTCEIEEDNQLLFLDILLKKDEDGTISTSVYRKHTHTDQYLQFSSHHPLSHKLSVVKTLFSIADKLSSTVIERPTEEIHITNALEVNGYPKFSIRKSTCTCSNIHVHVLFVNHFSAYCQHERHISTTQLSIHPFNLRFIYAVIYLSI